MRLLKHQHNDDPIDECDLLLREVSPDLSVALLHEVVAVAYAAITDITNYAPNNARGIVLYQKTVENLRGQLYEKGWTLGNDFGVPCVIDNSHKVRITVASSSDFRVGRSSASGPELRKKGNGTLKLAGCCENNQMSIFEMGVNSPELNRDILTKHDNFAFYYLIVRYDFLLEEISLELSMPVFSFEGEVVKYQERILIPAFKAKSVLTKDLINEETMTAPDIDVVRKAI